MGSILGEMSELRTMGTDGFATPGSEGFVTMGLELSSCSLVGLQGDSCQILQYFKEKCAHGFLNENFQLSKHILGQKAHLSLFALSV